MSTPNRTRTLMLSISGSCGIFGASEVSNNPEVQTAEKALAVSLFEAPRDCF